MGNPEAKNPKYHNYVSWGSYDNLIQSLVHQALSTIQSSYTSEEQSCKSMHRSLPLASVPPLRNPS